MYIYIMNRIKIVILEMNDGSYSYGFAGCRGKWYMFSGDYKSFSDAYEAVMNDYDVINNVKLTWFNIIDTYGFSETKKDKATLAYEFEIFYDD